MGPGREVPALKVGNSTAFACRRQCLCKSASDASDSDVKLGVRRKDPIVVIRQMVRLRHEARHTPSLGRRIANPVRLLTQPAQRLREEG